MLEQLYQMFLIREIPLVKQTDCCYLIMEFHHSFLYFLLKLCIIKHTKKTKA